VPINKGKGPDNGKKEVLALAKNGLPYNASSKPPKAF